MTFPVCFMKKTVKSCLDFGNLLLFSCFSKKKFEKHKIQKILLINLQGVGDIVMTTPLLSALRQEYPVAHIDYLSVKEKGVILSSDSRINRILSRKKDDFFSVDFFQTLQQIRSQKYDLVLNLFPSQHSALLTLFSGAPYIVGPLYSTTPVCSWSSQKMKPTWDVRLQCQQIASLLGISLSSPFSLSLVVPSQTKKNILKRIDAKKKYIVLNVPVQWKAKQWSVAHWRELICEILTQKKFVNYQLAFLGTSSEASLVEKVFSSFGKNKKIENWCGKWSLQELPAVLQHASLLITTDSGPMHIASAVQTQTIGLFGVTDPSLLVLGNPFIHVISSYGSCPHKFKFNHHCEPCDFEQTQMKKITVATVLEKALIILNENTRTKNTLQSPKKRKN